MPLYKSNSSSSSLTVSEQTFTGQSANATTWTDLTSISLTAGTWLITLCAEFPNNNGTNDYLGISTTSGNSGSGLVYGQNAAYLQRNGTSAGSFMSIANYKVTPTGTTTYYAKAITDNGGSSTNIAGRMTALKIA